MDEMKDRIKLIISDAHVTKTEFGKSINVSQSFVSQLCSGSSKPSDRTISDICRVYHISELWLRTGEGEMHSSTSEDDAVTAALASAMANGDTPQDKLLRTVARFPAEDIPAVVRFALSIIRETCPEALKDLPPDSPYAEK